MNKLFFGTAGIPSSTPQAVSTLEGIKQIKKLNLNCMELEFVQGIYLSEENTLPLKEVSKKFKVFLFGVLFVHQVAGNLLLYS